MNLIYEAGDIVFFRNVKFKDFDGKARVDIRLAGHPFLVLNDVQSFGDTCYALKITSRKLNNIPQYPLLVTSTTPKLRKSSFINLNKLFQFDITSNVIPCCRLKQQHFKKICNMMCKVSY